MRGIQVGGFDFLDEMRQEKRLVQRAKTLIMSDLSYEKSANINRLRGIVLIVNRIDPLCANKIDPLQNKNNQH
jgi:hypothetical protein